MNKQRPHNYITVGLDDYYNAVGPYFQVCADKSVLEIGPFTGQITEMYVDLAQEIELVEPNSDALGHLQQCYPMANIVWDDIFAYLKTPRKFDVVVCMGVLYHLHSPVQLLEQLVNEVKPQYIMLDVPKDNHVDDFGSECHFDLGIYSEPANTPGYYYTKPGKPGQRTPNIRLTGAGPYFIIKVMSAMGYQALNKPLVSPMDFKDGLAFIAFERID
jgi:SAM-dependent methyltransferase